MIYWFVNLNFNLIFSSSARGLRKKVKINKQWAFSHFALKEVKFLNCSLRSGQFKTTCLTDNRMDIDVKNGT